MHEYSLVRSLLSQVAGLLPGESAVEEIRLEIGPLAGVEPLLVSTAFSQLIEGSPLEAARLSIIEVPLDAVCDACRHAFSVIAFHFQCPECGSSHVRVVRGDEVRLLEITIRERCFAQQTSTDSLLTQRLEQPPT